MINHKTPLTEVEREGLIAHGLGRYIGEPSQLADVFRQGVAWALKAAPAIALVVTKNETGQIVAVTRQDEDGRIVEVLAESAPATAPSTALQDVATERQRQDAKWGGPEHDDHHTTAEFVQLIEDYAG